MILTAETLREMLDYDKESGIFRWKISGKGITLGSVAGTKRPRGYYQIKIFQKHYMAHRLAWFYVHGEWPIDQIDHKNRDPSDNRIENLREATQSQNNANRGANRHKQYSPLKGVSFYPESKRWTASIRLSDKHRHLGCFDTAEEAHAAYVKAASEAFGEFAAAA